MKGCLNMNNENNINQVDNTNINVNFDYLCRKMATSVIEVMNSYSNIPFTLKAYILDEITNTCKQQAEINIRNGFEREEKEKQGINQVEEET